MEFKSRLDQSHELNQSVSRKSLILSLLSSNVIPRTYASKKRFKSIKVLEINYLDRLKMTIYM